MKILKLFFSLLLLLVLVGVLGLGYLGFIPAISKLMGTDKPRDLGMKFTQENYDSGIAKSGMKLDTLPTDSEVSVKYEGTHEVKNNFSDDEINAHLIKTSLSEFPFSQVQLRINDDNSCEVSGIVKLTQMENYLSIFGVSTGDFEKALEKVNIPLADVPFYAKGMGTARDNSLSLDFSNIEVGRFPVPSNIVNEYEDNLSQLGNTIMKSIDGFSVKEARFENNSIYFDGTLPDVEATRR